MFLKHMAMFVFITLGVSIVLFVLIFVTTGLSFPTLKPVSISKSDRFADINGVKVRFRFYDKGGGNLVFLHGFGQDLSVWEAFAQSLDFGKIYMLDLVGFGLSNRPEMEYGLNTLSHYVLSFMDDQHIDHAVLVGTSMGASVALWTAAHYSNRIDAVAAFAPSAYPNSMRHGWPGNLLYRPNAFNRLLQFMIDTDLYRSIFPNSLAIQALKITSTYDQTFIDALCDIHQPVLLVWSRSDKRVPFSYCKKYIELLSNHQLIIAPQKTGHQAARHPNEQVNNWLHEILDENII